MPFATHRDVGPDSKRVVCPASVDSTAKCPICAERKGLMKADYDGNIDRIKELFPQKWVLYNAFDPEDDSKIVIFAFSRGKFAGLLESELMEADDDCLSFYDVTSDGRTLSIRFSKDTFSGTEFIKATRIDFKKRDELDEDDILERVACLDDCLVVLSEKELDKLHEVDTGGVSDEDEPEDEDDPEDEEEEDEDFEDEEEEDEPKPEPKKSKKKRRAPEPEEEEDEEEEDEEEEDDERPDEDTDDGDDELFC